MVPVDIFGLQVEEATSSPLLLLRERDAPHRVLPIFIGGQEAVAIVMGLQGLVAERPLTHDLLVELLESTETRLTEVAVTAVEDGTFLAELHLAGSVGPRIVASRPSDAIALAVRLDVPVFASEAVLDEAGAVISYDDGETIALAEPGEVPERGPAPSDEAVDEAVEELRAFLDEVDPADFGHPDGPGH